MEKERLKLIVRNLELLVDSLKAEIYSDTDAYKAEQINAFLRTEKDERALFPAFGITDPVFHRFDSGEFIDSFLEFYKPSEIAIEGVSITEEGGSVTNVAVTFN